MNPLSERLGIELPILQAPMAGVQDSALAIAVAHAGGLGALPCAMLGLDALRAELQRLAAGTSRPINLNLNRLMRELGPMSVLPPAFPLAAPALAPLRANAEADGRGDFSALWSGTRRPHYWSSSAAALTRDLAARA